MNVLVLGCGNMPQALLEKTDGFHFFTYTPSQSRAKLLAEKLSGSLVTSLDDLSSYDIILLGCKPQQFPELAKEIATRVPTQTLVVSMLAGITWQSLKDGLKHSEIIRIMPNITAQVDKGSILVYPKVNAKQEKLMEFLQKRSKFFTAKSEQDFDKLMLITGSGPAYIYYYIRSFERYLEAEGFDSSQYLAAIQDTFMGAIELMKNEPNLSTTDFIERVASKGGVTQEALAFFTQSHFDAIVGQAISNGVERSKALQEAVSK